MFLHVWTITFNHKPVLTYRNQLKSSQNCSFCPKYWPFVANSCLFCNKNVQNIQTKYQNMLEHHTELKHVHKSYVRGLISEFFEIGTFWPFLATFGIEIVTRCCKLFFKVLFSVKTANINE